MWGNGSLSALEVAVEDMPASAKEEPIQLRLAGIRHGPNQATGRLIEAWDIQRNRNRNARLRGGSTGQSR